jgi:hypothetical protein
MRKIIYLLFLFLSFPTFGQINDLKGNVKSLRVKVIPQKEKEETPEAEYYIDENGNEIKRTYKKNHDEYLEIVGPYSQLNIKFLKKFYHSHWKENASPNFSNFYIKFSKSRKPITEIWYGYKNSDKRAHYYYHYYQNDSLKYEIDKHYKPNDTIKYFYNKFGKEKVIDVHYYFDDKREVDSSKIFYSKDGLVKYSISYDKYNNATISEYKATEENNTIAYFTLRDWLYTLLISNQILKQNYYFRIQVFNKKSKLIKTVNYNYDHNYIIPSNQTLIKYNSQDKIVEQKYIDYRNDYKQYITNYNYENDLIASIVYINDNGYYGKKDLQYYDNKLVKRIQSYSPTDIRIANFEYEIDRKGNWTKMTMTLYFNGVESKHIMKRKIKYYN